MKKEVSENMKSATDRQDKVEAEHVAMKNDISDLITKVEGIKKIVEGPQERQQVQNQQAQQVQQIQRQQELPNSRSYSKIVESSTQPGDHLPSENSDRKKALDFLDLGRRTVSINPFLPEDCELELKRGAKDQNEARLWAVQTYFRYEMNIKKHILATFTIEDIFTLTDNYDTIYVTFSSITEANAVYSYTRNMRKATKVGIFVPREWQELE